MATLVRMAGDSRLVRHNRTRREPLTYTWRFPHDLWLAIAVNEEGGIALAIHPRDGILEGAFPQQDPTDVPQQPKRPDPSVGEIPTHSNGTLSTVSGGRRF